MKVDNLGLADNAPSGNKRFAICILGRYRCLRRRTYCDNGDSLGLMGFLVTNVGANQGKVVVGEFKSGLLVILYALTKTAFCY